MSNKLAFTIEAIERLPIPELGRKEYHDSDCPGLTIVVTKAGSKTFYRYGRVGGKPQRIRIGRFPTWSVAGARKQCRILSGEIAKGADPQAEKNAARKQKTMSDLWKFYFENFSKGKRTSWERELSLWNDCLKPIWGQRAVRSIERQEVVDFHTRIIDGLGGKDGRRKGGPNAGDRFLAMMRFMFEEAIENGWCEKNPTRRIEFSKRMPRRRYLKEQEVPIFWKELEAEPSRTAKDYFKLRIVTGGRSINVKAMRWDQLDFDEHLWEIPGDESKNRHAMFIPLVDYAIEILESRRPLVGSSPWVFPSRNNRGHHIQDMKKPWKSIITRAGLKNIRPHDLRRTLGTWQRKQGAELDVIGDSLGHKSQESTKVYVVNENDAVRASMQRAILAIQQAAQKKSENS